jgi:hypothetical protein
MVVGFYFIRDIKIKNKILASENVFHGSKFSGCNHGRYQ